MPIDRSEYLIELKTSADTAGVEKTMASAQEAREAFQLLRDSAAEALGPIGELIHILENPYLLAVAGATLATRTFVQQLQAARENAGGRIQPSPESHDGVGHAQNGGETQSSGLLLEKNERAPSGQEPGLPARAEAQSQGRNNATDGLRRLRQSLQLTQSGTVEGESAEAMAGATASEVRGSISRTQRRVSEREARPVNRARGGASSEDIVKLIELNDVLIGMEESQTAQQGALLDKIDSMMSRVQALEAAQRNTRWQAQ
jgi:hypothetical protein